MLALYGIFTCKLQNHSTVILNNMLQYYKKTNIHILTLRNSYKVKEHVLGHLLSGLFRSYCNPSLTVSRLFIRNSNYYIVRQNGPTPRQFGSLEPMYWLSSIKMSECLRTYGPQIIRVPQLQIEDWAWLVVPSYKLQN